MKTVALREAKQSLSGYIKHAQRERVLIIKHGKPAALVIGVEGQEIEDVLLRQDPGFWKLVEERRRQRTVPLAYVRKSLGLPGLTRKRGRARR
jgi:prevent-host-death family protein